jgi:DNA primase
MNSKIFKPYKNITEAVEMINEKQLSPASVDEFGLCYIPENVNIMDLLWCRLALPIHNMRGQQIAWAGRRLATKQSVIKKNYKSKYLDEDLSQAKFEKWNKSKWMNSTYEKSRNLFNIHRAYKSAIESNYIFLVEGYWDVIMFHQEGLKNIVATCGTSLTKTQAMMIKSICDHCFIIFDPDDAGILASERAQEIFDNIGLTSSRINLPNMLDPDEYIRKVSTKKFKDFMDNAMEKRPSEIILK